MAEPEITDMKDPVSGAEYQLIVPPNTLGKKVKSSGSGGLDLGGVAAADRGVQRHTHEFPGWINDWVDALNSAFSRFQSDPRNALATERLTAAAHEVKGGATMANAPALTALANPLCDLLERVDNGADHLDLIGLCVGAIDAARREKRFEADEKVAHLVGALDGEISRRTGKTGGQNQANSKNQAAGQNHAAGSAGV
jgi:HPt (histidine-containing phosphotransfer) domain-containing protein